MRAFAALGSVVTAFVLCACSGSDGGNIFPTPTPDAAPPAVDNGDAGDLVNGPGSPEAAPPVVCTPQSVASFQATWTPPEQWKQNVCTAAQVSGFYDACLSPPISPANCTAFVQANPTCAPCLQSQETDAQAAAVVWHEQKQYWSVNVAGCIARATGDATGAGCGAAYAAAIACRQQSCNACWAAQGTTATFPQFAACEQQAGQSTCATYAQAVPARCGDLTTGAPGACMPPSGATAKIAYMQVAPLFCGQ